MFQTICHTEDIAVGAAKMFVIGEQMVGVFNVDGEFFALNNQCPHAGASLAGGIIEGDCVRCRIHHWKFSIRDGTYLDADRPRFNAPSFPTRVLDGEVQVDLDEGTTS